MRRRAAMFLLLAAMVGAVSLAGCGGGKGESRKPPPAVVSIGEVGEYDFLDEVEISGRTEAVQTVEVKARATGYLAAVLFQDGDDVEEGQLLYVVDDAEYKQKVKESEASARSIEAQLTDASSKLSSARRMSTDAAISREEYNTLSSNKGALSASLSAAKAVTDRSKLDLSYTRVYSPISGRVSRTRITKGNIVTKDTTLLTTVVSIDPVYAYFFVDERTVLQFQDMISKKQVASYRDGFFPVYLGTQLDRGYPYVGRVDFVDNAIDPSTGTLRVRGVFPPATLKKITWSGLADVPVPGTTLPAGLSVRMLLPVGTTTRKAVLVDDRAIASRQGKPYVFVVNKENKVEDRSIETGALRDGMRVVTSGLKAGEWIIVQGLQRARPGATVEVNKVPMRPNGAPLPGQNNAKGK